MNPGPFILPKWEVILDIFRKFYSLVWYNGCMLLSLSTKFRSEISKGQLSSSVRNSYCVVYVFFYSF